MTSTKPIFGEQTRKRPGRGKRSLISSERFNTERQDRWPPQERRDKGKPVERRRRKATRLQRASRAMSVGPPNHSRTQKEAAHAHHLLGGRRPRERHHRGVLPAAD